MPAVTCLDLPVTKRCSPVPQIKHQSAKFNGHFCAHVHRLTISITPDLARNRGTNPSWQEKLSRSLSCILKMIGERRCIKSTSMSSFTAGAQPELWSYREPKHFSPLMEHYAVPASYNMMKTSAHFQFIPSWEKDTAVKNSWALSWPCSKMDLHVS